MQTERRRASRHGIHSLVYLEIEPDNGGILLDLSQSGMQISVANPLVTSGEIRFTLRLESSEVIHATGRVAWLSPSGRSAGVHFLDMPECAQGHIQHLLGVDAGATDAESASGRPEPAVAIPASASPEGLVESTVAPEPGAVDALELLESTLEAPETDSDDSLVSTASAASFEPSLASDAQPTPSFLSLYGIDGHETEAARLAASAARTPAETAATAQFTAGPPKDWAADRSPIRFEAGEENAQPNSARNRNDGGAVPRSRRSRSRVHRKKAARRHPPILLSPIFVPAPPPYDSLPSEEMPPAQSYEAAAPAGEAQPPQTKPLSAPAPEAPLTAAPASASLPEPSVEENRLLPGALYLPNYRLEQFGPSRQKETKVSRFGASSVPAIGNIFDRFEEFGRSLESDWHVWLGLILSLAGFLALAQKPPLIVLTIAFWFAAAAILTSRRRSQPGANPEGENIRSADETQGSVRG